jgi:hypothetical protein
MGLVSETLIVALVSAILGGGLFTGLASIIKAKAETKRIPLDLNSLSIGTAERALLMLKTALDEAEEKILQLKQERDDDRQRHLVESAEKDRRITELETDLRNFLLQFNDVQKTLTRVLKTAEEAKD